MNYSNQPQKVQITYSQSPPHVTGPNIVLHQNTENPYPPFSQSVIPSGIRTPQNIVQEPKKVIKPEELQHQLQEVEH